MPERDLNDRKMWVSTSVEGPRATCSDCAWIYPASGWGTRGPAAEEVDGFFAAHDCDDYPRSRPRNPAYAERRDRVGSMEPVLREIRDASR